MTTNTPPHLTRTSGEVTTTSTHRARLSIERRLPLVMGGLLLVVIVALSSAAYVEVRRTALRTASERLLSVTAQFRDLFVRSATQLRAQVMATAVKPAIVAFANTHASHDRAAALEALKYSGTGADQVLAMELRDATGRVLLSTDTLPHAILPTLPPPRSDSAAIGRFRSRSDTITIYAIKAPVQGAAAAYVVQWRRIAGTKRARQDWTQLVGSDASIFLGNPRGTDWTNLEGPVAPPSRDVRSDSSVQTYERRGERYLAAVFAIPGTPWLIAVDFPMRKVLAPVGAFMQRMALIALAALAIGLFAAWTLGKRIGVVELSNDVLEKKVAERTRELHDAHDALVRRERLAMLGQLSSGVGHELRNPLGVMTNAVYYLKTVLADAPANVHEYLEIIKGQVMLSEKIVDDLLDFARQKPPQRNPTSVADVTEMQLKRLGATNGVRISTDLPGDLPRVLVDQTQMGQIVLNLLTNAMQALGGKGAITIRAHRDAQLVNYEVADSGGGIAPENLEKIFEPLFTTKARGIGLGLALSRTLARANGGDLTVSSPPGKGATFNLTLSIATLEAA